MKDNLHSYSSDTKDRYLIHIYLILMSIGIAYLVHLLKEPLQFDVPWWISFPGIFGVYGTLYHTYANWVWSNDVIRKILGTKTPVISGIYKGTLDSSYDKFKDKKAIEIRIIQRWDKISIRLNIDSSFSFSQSCSIFLHDNDRPIIVYSYLNEPKAGAVDTMSIHYGMCTLYIEDGKLSGEFFTGRGRQTFGNIEVLKI